MKTSQVAMNEMTIAGCTRYHIGGQQFSPAAYEQATLRSARMPLALGVDERRYRVVPKKPSFTNKWYHKGRTGEVLRDIKNDFIELEVQRVVHPLHSSVAYIRARTDDKGWYTVMGITLRGSSKCRRKQARELARFLSCK